MAARLRRRAVEETIPNLRISAPVIRNFLGGGILRCPLRFLQQTVCSGARADLINASLKHRANVQFAASPGAW
jgi:hypothetical protein